MKDGAAAGATATKRPSARGRPKGDNEPVRGLVYASESHLADCRFRHLSPKTLDLYQEYEQSFIEWCATVGVPLLLPSLTATNVKLFSEYIRGRHGGKRNGEWAARSAVSTLKTWSRYLVDEDILEADYLSRVRLPQATIVARQAYEAWEIQALRGAMSDSPTATRDVAMLSLLLDTGMRISELVGMRLADTDLNARHVLVHGKGRLERILAFGNSAARDGGATVRRLRAYLAMRWAHPDLPEPERGRVWMGVHGRPLTDVGVRALFAKAAKASGLSHQEVHATRHTFAVRYLVRNPGDIEGLRYLLGHLSADMYRTYAGQAGILIAEVAGRESIADAMFAEERARPPFRPTFIRRDMERPDPASPVKREQESGRLTTRSKVSRHLPQ